MKEKIQKFLAKLTSTLNRNVYVQIVRDAMLAYTPITIIGGMFLIIAYLPFQSVVDFISNILGVEASVWQGAFGYVNSATLSKGALFVLVCGACSAAKHWKLDYSSTVCVSLASYLVLWPSGDKGAMTGDTCSANALLITIIVFLLGVRLFKFLQDKKIKIKMPEVVPEMVAKPLEALIPTTLTIMVFWVIRIICNHFETTFYNVVMNILGIPLLGFGGSLPGVLFLSFFTQLLWWFGIHGSAVTSAFSSPINAIFEAQNQEAAMAGLPVPNIISTSFQTFWGVGIVGSVIACLIVAKSKRYREVGKLAAVPYIFNVGEPALFGFPLMLNANFLIPMLISCPINIIIAYYAMKLGIVVTPNGLVPFVWTTPNILSGYIITQSWTGAALHVVQYIVATLIWLPFIKMEDARVYAEEQEAEKALAEKAQAEN